MSLYNGKEIELTTVSTKFKTLICGHCGMPFLIPSERYDALVARNGSFYCPNGHSRTFIGETEETKLKKQFAKEKAELEGKARNLHYKLIETEKNRVKLYNQLRASAKKKCPHCPGSYIHLTGHIQRQHGKKENPK